MKSKYRYFIGGEQAIQFKDGQGYWRHSVYHNEPRRNCLSVLSLNWFETSSTKTEAKRKDFFIYIKSLKNKV